MKLVHYRRVSTKKQGDSGLGLEDQNRQLKSYTERVQGDVIAQFEEIESGGNDARPELLKAIALCKERNATLVVAKLDRLARSVGLIDGLMRGNVPFVICDMPEADETTIYIIAAIGQRELKLIRKRTKDALAVKIDQGAQLGARNPNNAKALEGKRGKRSTPESEARYQRKLEARREQKRQKFGPIIPLVRELRKNGVSWGKIVVIINANDYMKGKYFSRDQLIYHMTPFLEDT